ncbi:60S ribosomal protein eL24 [Limtongia smithiae]|uniref:60S ribosomal protein eL24 n=1 Tax=Limtongia smithiae TaxID=1125753 RepID=UPI0034CDD651
MRTEIDSFSGNRIYPGRGKLFVRGDSKVFRFVASKSASLFMQRKNPRRIAWTVLYRRMHKKGITEEVSKKRARRTVKRQRAIVGATLEVIKEKRSIRPEVRSAARKESIAAAKQKKIEEAKNKAEKSKATKAAGGAKFSKQQLKGAAQKVAAHSR